MDKYDQAIEEIMSDTNPGLRAHVAWGSPTEYGPGCLFQFATANGHAMPRDDQLQYGCLTMISAADNYVAETDELTRMIRADQRIPIGVEWVGLPDLRPTLEVFAEWQRRLDVEIRGKAPVVRVMAIQEPTVYTTTSTEEFRNVSPPQEGHVDQKSTLPREDREVCLAQ